MTKCRQSALSLADLERMAQPGETIEARVCRCCGGDLYVLIRDFNGQQVPLLSHVPLAPKSEAAGLEVIAL